MSLADLPRARHALDRGLYRARRLGRRLRGGAAAPDGFSIVIVTFNRCAFLAETLAALLETTTHRPFEIIVWNNASTDDTRALVDRLAAEHDVVRPIHHRANIGTNGYAPAMLHARYRYLVEVDDDILAVEPGWDRKVVAAFDAIPRLGYVCLNPIQDELTNGAKPEPQHYREEVFGGVTLEVGPVGGWFAATTRAVYDDVGGFIYQPPRLLVSEDGDYLGRVARRGYRYGILRDCRVYHASGENWNAAFGYHKVWKDKYAESEHPYLAELVDKPRGEPPTVATARAALARAMGRS